MATVYLATDERLDRPCAVKIMHAAFAADPHFVERFEREARSAARLVHPAIVAVYDQGRDDDVFYLVMEYIPGRTLRELIHERAPLPPAEALRLLEPVLDALSAAHATGLVHRDIKPENLLLSTDGRVTVADFGLARRASTLTNASERVILGTVDYLAPEQVSEGTADARTDVYAAGICLYEMLTGRVPHTGDTPIAIAYQHVNADVPPPSQRRPGLPPEVDALVLRATRRAPQLRYADASAFLDDVRRILNRLPADPSGTTPPPARTTPLPRPTRVMERQAPVRPPSRRRATALAMVLLLIGVAAAITAGWYLAQAQTGILPGP
jgi:serine/threonine-protein kinase